MKRYQDIHSKISHSPVEIFYFIILIVACMILPYLVKAGIYSSGKSTFIFWIVVFVLGSILQFVDYRITKRRVKNVLSEEDIKYYFKISYLIIVIVMFVWGAIMALTI